MASVTEVFAASCEEQAKWREQKHEEWGDPRNLACAQALRAAAEWARTAPDAASRLDSLPISTWDVGSGFLSLNDEAQRIFSAYCFHRPEDIDSWVFRIFMAQARESDEELDSLTEDD